LALIWLLSALNTRQYCSIRYRPQVHKTIDIMSSQPPDDDRTVIKPRTLLAPEPPVPGPPPVDGGHLPNGTYLGEFELTAMLGEGGFGIVYLAWDHSLQRRVALKEYMPSSLAMRTGSTQIKVKSERHRETFDAGLKSFINEARLLAQFDHPSLVKVYRFWEANGTAYLVMPFYEGITVKEKLKEMGSPPDEAWLMGLLAPLTEALAVIHAENCFHRDIAPDNVILLAGTGKPLLLDFGAARRVIGDMTQALTVILKPGYAPVEQYAEAPGMKQGPWTDVYALAATVYFALLGKTPPPSVSRLMADSYVPLVESCAGRYSVGFLASIDKALRVRPEERTQSIGELRADLGLDAMTESSEVTQMPGDRQRGTAGQTSAGTSSTKISPVAAALAAGDGGNTNGNRAGHRNASAKWLGLGTGILLIGAAAGYFALSPKKPALSVPPPATAPLSSAAEPITPPTVASSSRFDVRTEFDRVMAAQTPGFDVVATATLPQLRIDKDNLSFNVKSTRDGFVTVLVLGPDGSLTKLVPSSEMPDIKIRAGVSLKLPPSNVRIETAEPAGPEHFMVIVSKQPRDYASLSTRQEGGYLSLPTGAEAVEKIKRLVPGGPILLGEAPSCSGPTCHDFGSAQFTIDLVR
jgi:serine/threonine protein kinase